MNLPHSPSMPLEDINERWFDPLDFPPPELLVKPMPCVVLTGLDIEKNAAHKAIADILASNDRKSDRLPINYIIRPTDHEYPKAKAKKSSYEWYVPRGILKTYWMRKHLTEVPAVVDPHWREKQTDCQTLVRTIQMSLTGRSTKIVLVVIQEGASLPPGGDAISEERCAALCNACGLQLQSSLFILQNNEQLQGCCLKLESRLFELAQHYYMMQTRKIKDHREFLNKTTHQLLFVRHHFKTGFLSEFFRPPDGIQAALKSYRQAFGHLMDVRTTDYNLREVKVIAGFISYKIWALSLIPGSNASQRDAELHFRKHIEWLRQRMGHPELAFEHYAWLASQYRMFADLFAEAVRSTGFTASISQHPGIYYHQAAMLTRERRKAILSAKTPELPKPGTILANGAVVVEGEFPHMSLIPQKSGSGVPVNEFYGQRSWRPGYQSLEPPDAPTESVGIAGLQYTEHTSVDHSAIVTQLLSLAGVHFRKLGASRMCTRLSWETANELLQTAEKTPKNADVALSLLRTVVSDYRQDHWIDLLREALLRQLGCPRISPSGIDDKFDTDYEQELASLCFELAAIPGDNQHLALVVLLTLVTYSELASAQDNMLLSKSLLAAWNEHVKTAPNENRRLSLDVSTVSPCGFVQAWAHFPTSVVTLDELPIIELYVNRVKNDSEVDMNLRIKSAGARLHYYYYFHKSKGSGSGATTLARTTVKTSEVEATEFSAGNDDQPEFLSVSRFLCHLNMEDAKTAVAAAITNWVPSKASDSSTGAYVGISGWWIEMYVRFGTKTGVLRLNWSADEEPMPPSLTSAMPLSGREFVKFQRRNSTPEWVSHSALSALSGSQISQTWSPFLCLVKPRKAHVSLEVCQKSMPALVGENFPIAIHVKNANTEAATSDMVIHVVLMSSTPHNTHTRLSSPNEGEGKPLKHMVVKVPAIAAGSEREIKAFVVKQLIPDVLNVHLKLCCESAVSSDNAVVEVVQHQFSLPVVSSLSLESSTILDFDTLTSCSRYNPHRRNMYSVKICSSSPHELNLVSLKLKLNQYDSTIECANSPAESWPRKLLPGASFVEAFDIPPISTLQTEKTSLGELVLQWRRSTVTTSTESVIPLPEILLENVNIIVRMTHLPARATLYKPCNVSYFIKNVSQSTLNLRASLQSQTVAGNDTPCLVSGPNDLTVSLLSGSSVAFPVSLVPLLSGFVPVPRLRISATSSSVPSSVPDVTDVLSPKKTIFVQTAPHIEWLLSAGPNANF